MSGLILAGDVYVQRIGVDTGFIKLLNAKEFKITVEEADTKSRKSYGRSNYMATIQSYATPGDHSLSVVSDEFDRDTLAMAFLGSSASVAVTAGNVASAPITPVLNQWVEFSDSPVKPNTVVDAAATAILGTDFEIDGQGGMLKAITPAGVAVTAIKYDRLAATGYVISAQTTASMRAKVRLLGVNLTSGEKVKFEAESVNLTPSGDINLLADDFNTFTMAGGLELATGKTAPYKLTVLQ